MTPVKVAHRINTVEQLKLVPADYGIELDLRPEGKRIILHHDAFQPGEDFEEFLAHYRHKLLILNTKAEGMEDRLLQLMERHGIADYFFLDLSLPFLIRYAKRGVKKIAVRYSEYEPLELVERFAGLVDWVWVDCFTKLILDPTVHARLKKHFKLCLVSPELQGHPLEWVEDFQKGLRGLDLDAVCTKRPDLW